MKKNIEVLFYTLLVLGVILMAAVSCKKNNDVTPDTPSNNTPIDTIGGTWIGGAQTPSTSGYPTFTNNIVVTHISGNNYTCSGFFGNYTVPMIRYYNVSQGNIQMKWDYVTKISIGDDKYISEYLLNYLGYNNKIAFSFNISKLPNIVLCQYSGAGYHR
jgi:hypothetical protein